MKNKYALLLINGLILTSCGQGYQSVDVTTSIFPHFDLVRAVAQGSDLTYSMIVPPGVEVHTYRPTPRETAQIQDSKLFFYSSDLIETWVSGMSVKGPKIVNVSHSLFEDDEHQHDDEEVAHGVHYWTNPLNFIAELEFIRNELSLIDTANLALFENNANDYRDQILSVSDGFTAELVAVDHPQVFFVGHNAMENFGEYFGIDIIPLVEDIKPDADVTPSQLANLVDEIVSAQAKYLFVEELASPTFALTVKAELKTKHNLEVEILELHGYHNLTLSDFDTDVTYLDLLNRNITNLKRALL